jgi:serine/threonine protein kinase
MTPLKTARALVIFEEVLAVESEQRSAYAQQICEGDADLYEKVMCLLEWDARATHDGFLREPLTLVVEPLPQDTIVAERFRLIRYIGGEGGGHVYEAEDNTLGGASVALKILHPLLATTNDRSIKRFLNESKCVAKLSHPNIVPVFSAGEDEGRYYYVMQLIRGQDLKERIKSWKHDKATSLSDPERIRRVVEFMIQAARGLQHAHDMGLIHRDIKPGNLLIDSDDNLWITDFGLAQLRDPGAITASGGGGGTLPYMSPEQLSGGRLPIDVHTDVYSLGVTLYEMLALQHPFEGSDTVELLRKIPDDEPVRLRILNPHVPGDLESIVRRAMAKVPTERYRSAKELGADLQRFLNGEPIEGAESDLNSAKAALRTRLLNIVDAAIDTLDKWALLEPSLNDIQQNLLRATLPAIVSLAEQETDEHWRLKMADACRRVGEVQRRLGEFDEARAALEKAALVLTTFVNQSSKDDEPTRLLARTKLSLGVLFCDCEQFEDGKRSLYECLELCAKPLNQSEVGLRLEEWRTLAIAAHLNLGVNTNVVVAAERSLRRSVELSRVLHDNAPLTDATPRLWLALSLYRLGLLLEMSSRPELADQAYAEVLDVIQGLGTAIPTPGWGRLLCRTLISEFGMRDINAAVFKRPHMEPLYQLSIELMKRLATHDVVPEYRLFLGVRHLAYGTLLMLLDRSEEAEAQFSHAIQTYEALIRQFGQLPEYCDFLAVSHNYQAEALSELRRTDEADRSWELAIRVRENLVRRAPQIQMYRRRLVEDMQRRAEHLERSGKLEAAFQLLRRSEELGYFP